MKVLCERSWMDQSSPGVGLWLCPDHLVREVMDGPKGKYLIPRELKSESDLDLPAFDFGD